MIFSALMSKFDCVCIRHTSMSLEVKIFFLPGYFNAGMSPHFSPQSRAEK